MISEYKYQTELLCRLRDGSRKTILRFPVYVEAETETQARSYLRYVAEETVDDLGSEILPGPLDYLEVKDATLVQVLRYNSGGRDYEDD